jgi:hypothetical protein
MKIMPIVFALLIGLAGFGCESDGDSDKKVADNSEQSIADEEIAGERSESKEAGARACFPDDYRLPNERDVESLSVTLTASFGNPGDPYYQISTWTTSRHYAVYSDGSRLSEISLDESELIVDTGVTSSTKRVEQRIRLTLFDGSEIGTFLYEEFENGQLMVREHLAAIECNDGSHAVISRREFERYRAQLGF